MAVNSHSKLIQDVVKKFKLINFHGEFKIPVRKYPGGCPLARHWHNLLYSSEDHDVEFLACSWSLTLVSPRAYSNPRGVLVVSE
jgi:hypothetical protein